LCTLSSGALANTGTVSNGCEYKYRGGGESNHLYTNTGDESNHLYTNTGDESNHCEYKPI